MDVTRLLQQCKICSKTFQFKCRLEEHMKTHKIADAQICCVCKKQFRRNDFFIKHQNECNFNKNKQNNITCVSHNKTKNEEFVPSFALIFNNSSEDVDFDITKNLIQSLFQNDELQTLTNNLEPLVTHPCIRSSAPPSSSHSNYHCVYRESKDKVKHLESIGQSLASSVKRNVAKAVSKNESIAEVLYSLILIVQ